MKYNLNFLSDDIQNGLLKNIRVGMIRRIVKILNGVVFDELVYFPQFKEFVVLRVRDRFGEAFKIKDLKGGNK